MLGPTKGTSIVYQNKLHACTLAYMQIYRLLPHLNMAPFKANLEQKAAPIVEADIFLLQDWLKYCRFVIYDMHACLE